VKLKKAVKDINLELGYNWGIKLNMKTNQLRVAEKIQEYTDENQKAFKELSPMTKHDLPLYGDWQQVKALVKHPDYRQLIPSICYNKQGLILVEFEARHPDLGTKFTFSKFSQDGLVYVGYRQYQLYKRDPEQEGKLRNGTVLEAPWAKVEARFAGIAP